MFFPFIKPICTTILLPLPVGCAVVIIRPQASSGAATNTAIAVLSLVSVADSITSAEAAIPLYLRRRTGSYGSLASFNKIVSNVFGSGRSGKKSSAAAASAAEEEGGGGGSGGSPTNGPKPQLHALVLTKNREIAAGVTVRGPPAYWLGLHVDAL